MNPYETGNYELFDVTDFTIVGDYTLRVVFNDGSEQVIDFEPILYGPMFGPLRDPSIFNRVQLDHEIGTLVWPTGADIDPTILHDWPEHVEAISKRRKDQYAISA